MGYKIVHIQWEDASSTYGWRKLDTDGPVRINTVGYEIEKNKRFIVVSTSVSAFGMVLDQLTIPIVGIIKYKVLHK